MCQNQPKGLKKNGIMELKPTPESLPPNPYPRKKESSKPLEKKIVTHILGIIHLF
jgi:hypothetical protein